MTWFFWVLIGLVILYLLRNVIINAIAGICLLIAFSGLFSGGFWSTLGTIVGLIIISPYLLLDWICRKTIGVRLAHLFKADLYVVMGCLSMLGLLVWMLVHGLRK